MGYSFTIKNGVRVKKDGDYPWPLKTPEARANWRLDPGEADRTIPLSTSDVLTKSEDGTYMVHTGIGCFGIVLQDDEVEPWGEDKHLRLL